MGIKPDIPKSPSIISTENIAPAIGALKAAASPATTKYVKAYEKKYGKEPDSLGALGYDAYGILLDAIQRAGSTDPQKIRDALATTKNFMGVTGYITIKNGNAVKSAVIKEVKNGQWSFVTVVNP